MKVLILSIIVFALGIIVFDQNAFGIADSTPQTVTSFEDNFEGDMSKWYVSSTDDSLWSIRATPINLVPNSITGNKVTGTDNCDTTCTMEMVDKVDLTQMSDPELSFYRYVGIGADVPTKEGIVVYSSNDGGTTWSVLDRFTADVSKDDGAWNLETYTLDNSINTFKVKFEAISSSSSEDTEIDAVKIYDKNADTIAPVITQPNNITKEATAVLTPLTLTIPTVTDDSGETVTPTSNATSTYPVGNTIVAWTASDSAGNTSTVTQSITITDTTPPILVIPADISSENPALTLGFASATDIVDLNPTITNNATSVFTSTYPIGTTIVTWIATDASGNNVSLNQSITIGQPIDILNDTFDTNIDGWEYFGASGYTGSHSSDNGGSLLIEGDSFSSPYVQGMQKTVDTSQRNSQDPLYVSFDYQIFADFPGSTVTNAQLSIHDSNDRQLYHVMPFGGGDYYTDWRTFTSPDISSLVSGNNTITVKVFLSDSWEYNWYETVWFDNVRLGVTDLDATTPTLPLDQETIESNIYDELSVIVEFNGTAAANNYLDTVPSELLALYQTILAEVLLWN